MNYFQREYKITFQKARPLHASKTGETHPVAVEGISTMLLIHFFSGDHSGKERVTERQADSLLPMVRITQQIWQTPVPRRRNQSSVLQRRMMQCCTH